MPWLPLTETALVGFHQQDEPLVTSSVRGCLLYGVGRLGLSWPLAALCRPAGRPPKTYTARGRLRSALVKIFESLMDYNVMPKEVTGPFLVRRTALSSHHLLGGPGISIQQNSAGCVEADMACGGPICRMGLLHVGHAAV